MSAPSLGGYKYCPQCATPLAWVSRPEDGGDKERLRCTACEWTHWNNPTPVLAAVVQYQDRILLARNAAWTGKFFALITGFMEAGETPAEGIARATAVTLIECVSRLWISGPAPGCAITCVTADRREKYGEKRMRSRSSRNCECSPVTSTLELGSGVRRAARSGVMLQA